MFDAYHLTNFSLSLDKNVVSGVIPIVYRPCAKLCSWSHPELYRNVFCFREDLSKNIIWEREIREEKEREKREKKARQGKVRGLDFFLSALA